ncbi:MAG: hypothetical protein C0467_28065 [Planctomycetaceae bacterium]|nr:hypothetical protein [Planctomycetaceae bacterium]
MVRVLLLLTSFTALAAWAGAQGPTPPLSAADKIKLFKSNRTLIENLVNHGIALSSVDAPLKRAEECRRTAVTLGNYLERAAKEDRNPDRVAELAGLMGDVVRDGLAPNLDEAERTTPAESPDGKRVKELQTIVATDLDNVRLAVPAGKVADNAKVKAALAALAELKSKFGK